MFHNVPVFLERGVAVVLVGGTLLELVLEMRGNGLGVVGGLVIACDSSMNEIGVLGED